MCKDSQLFQWIAKKKLLIRLIQDIKVNKLERLE